MDISEKKTVLDDSASIYQKREEKSDRAKWKDLKGFKAKWEHFREYYLLKTFIWVCVVAFVGYAVYEIFAPEKERLLYVSILDRVIADAEMEEIKTGFETYLSFDEETLELDTVLGRLTVKGEEMHIISFHNDSGDLTADGRVHALVYVSDERSSGLFSRIFR